MLDEYPVTRYFDGRRHSCHQLIDQFLTNFSNRVLAAGEGAAAEEAAQKVAEQPKDLNALALLWAMIAGFFRRLFGRKETT